MRNRLLKFNYKNLRTIRIVDEIPREINEILVLNKKTMGFHPKPEKPKKEETDEEETALPEEEAKIIWEPPSATASIEDRHTDQFLQTLLDPETLQKRLFYIYQEARSANEELGCTL